MDKLGIIVPYRDRYKQLMLFKEHMTSYLKDIEYEIIVVEQDDGKLFNRGYLLNIGFLEAKRLHCNYVIFHDIDMLPIKVDYSYSDKPLHLVTDYAKTHGYKKENFDTYFGGVTLFPIEHFEQINGYSNKYWGWGFEDDDLLHRCLINNVPLDVKETEQMGTNGAALKFNGNNAIVKGKNVISTKKNFSIYINFEPIMVLNHEEYDDKYNVFTIPAPNGGMSISYNCFNRYNFEIYNHKGKIIYLNSNISTEYKTSMFINVDVENKTISMYQDGKFVDKVVYDGKLYDYKLIDDFYLGCSEPFADLPNYFRGTINSFAIFDKILEEDEIIDVLNNKNFGLTQNFGNYRSDYSLLTYYDAKFIKEYKLMDLSGNDNVGIIENCEIVPFDEINTKLVAIPFRRKGLFKLLPHQHNGYDNGSWVDVSVRYNQLKYSNEVLLGYSTPDKDGLNSCEYKLHDKTKVGKTTHMLIGI